MKEQDSEKYFKDLAEWQNNQYSPGYFLGGRIPFSLKQFGKKPWFRVITAIYLILFFTLVIFGLYQMLSYILQ